MPKYISTPTHSKKDTFDYNQEYKFGFYETIGQRRTQEDALTWQTIETSEFTLLNPIDIAYRLWTSHQILDDTYIKTNDNIDGTTASTTIFDGKGNLITATLGDAVTFTTLYDKAGKVLGVTRLNTRLHKPNDTDEEERINQAQGSVFYYKGAHRLNGSLAVSRAIGDRHFKTFGLSAEPSIDINSVEQITESLHLNAEDVHSIQIITTCDGFTEGAYNQTKEGHESFLLHCLTLIENKNELTEAQLAETLVKKARKAGSRDNVSVALKTITEDNTPFLLGMYDGHNGAKAATFVANNMGDTFVHQCTLREDAYAEQAFSVNKHWDLYVRDNPLIAHVEFKNNTNISKNLFFQPSFENLYPEHTTNSINPFEFKEIQ